MPASPSKVALPGQSSYNGEVADVVHIHDGLMIFRVRPDFGRLAFTPGQYTALGLGNWEPRVSRVQLENPQLNLRRRLIKRAYSIGGRMLNAQGELVRAATDRTLEFYITLVRSAEVPPALTPRLFHLKRGDRLFVGPHAHGHYTLRGVHSDDQVIFAATGTGEAPHNAMLTELLSRGHVGRIVVVTCVRYHKDLAYLEKHRALEQQFSSYSYVALTTREPENVDSTREDYIGKRYLQDLFESDDFFDLTGCHLDPRRTHVFLCGSPDMIGARLPGHSRRSHSPSARGMIEVLENRGFRVDQQNKPGNIHFEKYW